MRRVNRSTVDLAALLLYFTVLSGVSPSMYKGRMRDDAFSMIDETPTSDLRCECASSVTHTNP